MMVPLDLCTASKNPHRRKVPGKITVLLVAIRVNVGKFDVRLVLEGILIRGGGVRRF